MLNEFMEAHPELERATALRFLLGRKFILQRAEDCLKSFQETVKQHNFQNVTITDVLEELRTQKLCIPGTRDRNGAALFVINAARHVPSQTPDSQENALRLAFFMAEKLTSQDVRTQRIGVTLISNMAGMEWASFDNQFQRSIIDFFQNNVPARVKNILLYKCPWWVSMMVRMVSPFLKEKMRNRIHICEEGDLQQFIETDQLPVDLGGTYEYDHEAWIRREMAKMPSNVFTDEALQSLPKDADDITAEFSKNKKEIRPLTPPVGSTMLIDEELSAKLDEERDRILGEIEEKMREHQDVVQEHALPPNITQLVKSRLGRMSVDLGSIPTLQPQGISSEPIHRSSILFMGEMAPLAEVTEEDYESPEKLQSVIVKRLRKNRNDQRRQSQNRQAKVENLQA